MKRASTPFPTATANSAATSHQKCRETAWCVEIARTIPSMMSLVIQSSAMGKKEATIREISPNETIPGPDSQTIRKVGGTFRSAEIRCRQLVVTFVVFSVTRPLIHSFDSLAKQMCRYEVQKPHSELSVRPREELQMQS